MNIEIRPIQGEELLSTYYPLMDYVFRETPRDPETEKREKLLPYRAGNFTLGAFENGKIIAGGTTIPMTQTLRGHIYPMGGVSGIGTYPEGRRKGYARDIMLALLLEMHRQGQVISSLVPFRESFYERLGYVAFPLIRTAVFSPTNLSRLLRQRPPGETRVFEIKEKYDLYRQFKEELQPSIHGMSLHPAKYASHMAEDNKYWLAIARDEDNQIAGMMRYIIKGYQNTLEAHDFFYKNSIGKYQLLYWLARHIDQVKEIQVILPPDNWIETWYSDMDIRMRTLREITGAPNPAGRVVIVENLNGMTVGEGQFSAKITDLQCEWNNGIFAFREEDGHLRVSKADSADCELTIQGLSALVFGGYEPADFAFRKWGNPAIEVQATMQKMFPLALPFLHEWF